MLQKQGDLNRVALLHLFGFPNLLSCLLDQSLTKFVSLPFIRKKYELEQGLKDLAVGGGGHSVSGLAARS